ncbi:hypothetical protein J7M07_08530, partial [bacterium]|nr:hypothetical protein [bacterium]
MRHSMLLVSIFVCLVLLPLSVVIGASESPREFPPVQDGFTTSGVMTLPYAPNRVMIKFTTEGFRNSKFDIGMQKNAAAPGKQTGIVSLDALGQEIGITKISHPYIELKNKVESNRLGINRWFMVELAEGSDVLDAVNRYKADPNIEYAKLDLRAFPAVVPSDPLYADHWGHNNTAQLPDLDWGGTYDHTLSNTVGTPGF